MRLGKRDKNSIASPSDNVDKTLEGEHTKKMTFNEKEINRSQIGAPFYISCDEYSEKTIKEFEYMIRVLSLQAKGASIALEITMAENLAYLAKIPEKSAEQIWEFDMIAKRYFNKKRHIYLSENQKPIQKITEEINNSESHETI